MRARLLTTAALLATALPLIACANGSVRDGRRVALEAELAALEDYLRAGAPSPGEFEDILVVVREPLIEALIEAVLPIEATIGDLRLRLDAARVDFRPGLAVVSLETRVSPRGTSRISADVSLLGAFEVRPGPSEGEDLTARVRVFGVDTRDVRLGALAPPAERLVNKLARLRTERLNELLGSIDLPVRLVEGIGLPAVDEDQVTIPAAELPIRFELASVRVLEEGILISLRLDREWTDVARWSAGGLELERGGGP